MVTKVHNRVITDAAENVQDHGALGDGVADDTAEFQTAITAAGIGGRIIIPPGVYVISSQLDLLTGQIVWGYGNPVQNLTTPFLPAVGDGTAITYTGATGFAFRANDKNSVIIGYIYFTAPTTTDGAVQFLDSDYCRLHDVTFRNVPNGDAYNVSGASFFNVLEDCLMRTSIKNGIHYDGVSPNSNLVKNVEISGAAVDIGVFLESGNGNVFDLLTVEPVATTAHIKLTGTAQGHFPNLRVEGTVGTEAWISVASTAQFTTDNKIVKGLASRLIAGEPDNAILGLSHQAFNNQITDPMYMRAGNFAEGFSLTVGTLSTNERSTTRPNFATEGFSWHGVSSAALVDVTFSITDASIIAAAASRDSPIGVWVRQVSGTGAAVVAKTINSGGNQSNTRPVIASNQWEFIETILPAASDLTELQLTFRLGASGNDVYFYLPFLNVANNDLVAADRVLSSAGGRICGPVSESIHTLANDATPSVLDGNVWLTGGTTTITDFDDGILGQKIEILSEHAITITDGTNIILNGSINFVMASGDSLTLRLKADNLWYEVSRMVNL